MSRPELVCSECGVEVVRRGERAYHVEAIPEGMEYHAPVAVPADEMPEPDEGPPSLAQRQTAALESIAESLRTLVHHLTAGSPG